ncbi:SDR family NAD(P)-dependent oxidoreductase [Aerosakkonemataceae cyanobacterium BLCC-F50]|uniref:SDR family NAD(P)-dependent oxidoreductase n=1 Tax=Floridaenema flaviceps BLCC-F50 TaxID=3153642 RepID=A0ABV4Y332_9CYAN
MTQLSEAVVLITGAAGGFGQEFTRQLLMVNSQLILTDLDRTVLEKQAEIIQGQVSTGKIIACLTADLSHRQGCEKLYHQVKLLGVPVDILINNAGIGLFGRIIPKPAVYQLQGDEVEFVDRTKEKFDLIVCATGYDVSYPFLPSELQRVSGAVIQCYAGAFLDDYKGLYKSCSG